MVETASEQTPLLVQREAGHTSGTTSRLKKDAHPHLASHESSASPSGTHSSPSNKSVSTAISTDDAAADGHTEANQKLSRARTLLCISALGCLILLQAINISILTTTQSDIAADLNVYEQTSWFTSSYLITMSSLAPLNGKLSAVFSPRSCIFASSIIMAGGAVIAGFARDFTGFVAGRAIIGAGGSGVFVISIIIVLELTGSKHRGLGVGLLNTGYTVGVAVGATAAGALLPVLGWRALFWLQAPVAVLGGAVLFLVIPKDFTADYPRPIVSPDDTSQTLSTWERLVQLDYLGALTLTGSIFLLLFALSSPKRIPILPIILSAIVFIAFVLNEIYLANDPIIPVSLLRSRGLLLTCLGTVGYMMARWSVLFFTPTFAIAVRQWSPALAGSTLIPTNAGFATGGLLVGWLHIRRPGSFYMPTLLTYAIFPVTLLMLGLLATRESSAGLIVLVLFVCGFTTGAALNYNLAHLLHLTPRETHYVATALLATFRGFAGSFGSAIGGGFFTRTLSTSLTAHFEERGMLEGREDLVRRLLGTPALVGSLQGTERIVAIQGYQDALKVLWLGAAGLAALMVLVQAGTGWTGQAEKVARREESQCLLSEEVRDGEIA